MQTIRCQRCGRVSKTFGYRGQLIILLDIDRDLFLDEPVFLLIDGKPVPFMLKSAELKSYKEWVVEFEDIDNPDKARRLCGLELALASEAPIEEEEVFELKDYIVKDKNAGIVGTVLDIMQLPMHDLLVVKTESRELLIPLSEGIILKIHTRKKQIDINAPEGLLGLNE